MQYWEGELIFTQILDEYFCKIKNQIHKDLEDQETC